MNIMNHSLIFGVAPRALMLPLTNPIRHQAVSFPMNAAIGLGDVLLVPEGVQDLSHLEARELSTHWTCRVSLLLSHSS